MAVRKSAGVTRDEVVRFLENSGIQTRMLFAGNLIKHPCFDGMRASGEGYRVSGDLANTDIIMDDAFWIGVYPGMDEKAIGYMVDRILFALQG
jgi:CDP-6-deoxy-D-xylo-4-hexulose-3-dehydrase